MKFNKKKTMIISFTLGTLLFASTALADIVNKSGYEQLKDSVKITAENCSENLNSFTAETNMVLKDNGKVLVNSSEIIKFDRKLGARESQSTQESAINGNYNHYSYEDKKQVIRKGNGDETYYVTEYSEERKDYNSFNNPFKENGAEDIEKIADAIVGSLKDHVVVKENADGSKEYSGSLNEMQIPALVNAVASFQLKQEFNGRRSQIPTLTKDIFVKDVSGYATTDKNGLMESIRGSAVLSGKDNNGNIHEMSLEVLFTFSDVNSTVVNKPDLTNKKVVKEVAHPSKFGPEVSNPQKFVGKFKNDIIIEKDSRYIKIGERFVELTAVNNQQISGKYYEVYKEGFDQYAASGNKEFTFNATFDKDPYNASFNYTDDNQTVQQGGVYLDQHLAKVYLNFQLKPINNMLMYDSVFSIVLE